MDTGGRSPLGLQGSPVMVPVPLSDGFTLAPSDPRCLHNLTVICYERMEIDASIEAADRAIMMKPDLAGAHFARPEVLLIKGQLAEGWEEYEWRFRIADAKAQLPKTGQPQWDGLLYDDARLLLMADQGFGDVIQFSRYIPWVTARCPDAVIAGSPEIVPVLRQFLPEGRIIVRWEREIGYLDEFSCQ